MPNKPKVAGSGTDALSKPKLEKSLLPLPLSKALQELEIVLVSNVTAPTWAKARPHSMLALVFNVMSRYASMLPAKFVLVPKVAELPTMK